MRRRIFLEKASKIAAGTIAISTGATSLPAFGMEPKVDFLTNWDKAPNLSQAPLPYLYNALEPIIDAATMEIHYTKHAAAYTKNMNDAIVAENAGGKSLEQILANVGSFSTKMRNNAGGHYNHESFWQWMTPGGKPIPAPLEKAIVAQFGTLADMKTKFNTAATSRFGSGWVWLVVDKQKKLVIGSTPNQDNPLMDVSELKGYPLLGLDVWEHAYYLKYQNKRADYATAWWQIVNWETVAERFAFAQNHQ